MSRLAWIRLAIVLIALPLASCFNDEGTCPTCPPDNSGRIDVLLAQDGDADSLHVTMDGGQRITLKRGKRISYTQLSAGTHSFVLVRWFEDFGLITTRTTTVDVKLAPGEARVILMHNDFPLVVDAFRPGRAPLPLAARPAPHGWASA
jgi:hypothetical protein